jgi:hypothetical protein
MCTGRDPNLQGQTTEPSAASYSQPQEVQALSREPQCHERHEHFKHHQVKTQYQVLPTARLELIFPRVTGAQSNVTPGELNPCAAASCPGLTTRLVMGCTTCEAWTAGQHTAESMERTAAR